MKYRLLFLVVVLFSTANTSAVARDLPEDPLQSVMWQAMAERYMPGGQVVFDDRVKVMAPLSAENQFQVPVTVDATALENVEEIVAVADLNPIPLVLSLRTSDALAYIGFRLKLQQSSPIHVGVRTSDGVWHVSGVVVDAAGGGCTAPAAAHGTSNWMQTLGDTRAFASRDNDSSVRMTLRMQHPMDTGLAAGIPAFYLNELTVRDVEGKALAELDLYEPVSENPTLTLRSAVGRKDSVLYVSSRDTEGNTFSFPLNVPAATGP